MGRKSLAIERTEQILDAFEVCILKYGFDGSSMARIAEEAGMKRTIIRHYIGNRDAVVKAMVERLIDNHQRELADAIASIAKDDFATVLLDYLFLECDYERPSGEILLDALWAKQESDPHIKTLLTSLYEALEDIFTDGLSYAYPQANLVMCRNVAYSLLCLLHTHSSLVSLGLGQARSAAIRQIAGQIVAPLAGDSRPS